ncbi:hydroxyisourate hydrolase [Pseudomonas neustonica]|uniref:5-hydroxyisourate hydrolase n=1 Tax=Pseudomonas neustonica TaxID=2487346 RepID=A0ABX9XDP4_9PSED|nr:MULTISPECIES: hydroxyisourate hydrolase [Pseudomonas]MAB23821.1 hydroxyisourate hydrolase [Pseudomonadales bacterium]MBA6421639.1 hydroxyisourate hydrolase [Pseudomonas sp. 5Ae-yellow]ROZ80283.1 hydroxyisourate hydrolase [Pseudomonas sp. SSM44]ROZ81345.1 hydroxyisourate hydrolase [Pseudomonas neustonica]|tara:strand:+ start:3845 stop:4255 length:411 start_codon:yes stop_codon:yes gene_type:complete
MNAISRIAGGILLASCTTLAMAAGNPLSVHVLNLEDGLPSSDVHVTLERLQGQSWQPLSEGVTNEQGRITELFPQGQTLQDGTYKVTFKTGDWFAQHEAKTFFPEVPVIFAVDASVEHYHIPLLLSPYGFSTYRGN